MDSEQSTREGLPTCKSPTFVGTDFPNFRPGIDGGLAEMVPGKRQLGNGRSEDSTFINDEVETWRVEEDRLRHGKIWELMTSRERASLAVFDVVQRIRTSGDLRDYETVISIIRECIKGLESSPHKWEWMAQAAEWPSFVPGGPESGPLRRAWAKGFENKGIGCENNDIPLNGKVDLAAGKPARFSLFYFQMFEGLRQSVPDQLSEEISSTGAIAPEPKYVREARTLSPLTISTAERWRDLAMLAIEAEFEAELNWNAMLQMLPGRQQTARTRSQLKADKGTKYGTGKCDEIDESTARALIAGALLDGFRSLAKLA